MYDPPLSYDKLPEYLKNDPVHSWRAKTGIELIHEEPTLEELNRIWANWQFMTDEQKDISDNKSIELFGIDNKTHYEQLIKKYIMYFSSPNLISELKGKVFLSPRIGISSLFIIDRSKIMNECIKKYISTDVKNISYNIEYDEWGLPNDELNKPLKLVHMHHNIKDLKQIERGTSTGYIYQVDISDVKDKLKDFDKNPNHNRELVYEGDTPLEVINVSKHTLDWELSFDENCVKRHGVGIAENVNQVSNIILPNINTPEELLKWMSSNIQYGWVSKKTKLPVSDVDADDESLFYKYYFLQSPEELIAYKTGVCWDQAELERRWFNQHSIKNIIVYFRNESYETHTCLFFERNDVWFWFENSWDIFKGIHEYKDLNMAISEVKNKFKNSNTFKESPVSVSVLKDEPRYGISCKEFLNYANKQEPYNFNNSINEQILEHLINIIKEGNYDYPYTTQFVIQDHYASTHHFDLRIKRDNYLASWAIPKARLPEDDNEKILAIKTNNHNLSWLKFEGTIPDGNYGAGTVTIYDSGDCLVHRWTNVITVTFNGNKIKDTYSLIKTNNKKYIIVKKKLKYERVLDDGLSL